jgi:FkbM family methyltransferase
MTSIEGSVHAYLTARPNTTYQAQYGEDRWLEQYFDGKRDGHFVDVGAYDGRVISNTYHLEKHLGWTGILVEPHPVNNRTCRVFACAAAEPGVSSVQLLDVPGGEVYSTTVPTESHLRTIREYGLKTQPLTVPARTLDSMIEEAGLPRVDLLSIDVEGAEPHVLSGFAIKRWKPAVVVIEDAPKRRPAVRNYFLRAGYAWIYRMGGNDLYVPVSFARIQDAMYHRVEWRSVDVYDERNTVAAQLRRKSGAP